MTVLDELERVIFEAETRRWLADHGQPASRENLDGAWDAATRHPNGRRERARDAAAAILQRFTITPATKPDCHSIHNAA